MEAFTGISAADILQERQEARVAGRLAHSPNVHGEVMARVGCPCYTCRDVFDPTGEEDARQRNCPPPPPSPPVLRRQNAVCLCCGVGHTCTEPCSAPWTSLGPSASGPMFPHLPPPPLAIRARQVSSTHSNVCSPVAAVMTPLAIDEVVKKQEASLTRRLTRLLESYARLEEHISSEETKSRSHDEMMMYQTWWEEMDRKRRAVSDLLRELQH